MGGARRVVTGSGADEADLFGDGSGRCDAVVPSGFVYVDFVDDATGVSSAVVAGLGHAVVGLNQMIAVVR